ncbi:MFS transporter [Demequina iriomotensis]|uniref:MFS transporter n=1 Tax=Demequina iriomotensis TaxID=1536641 RepID=UPI000782B5FE|nr:MFS transporter [Demequina iriomotensis]
MTQIESHSASEALAAEASGTTLPAPNTTAPGEKRWSKSYMALMFVAQFAIPVATIAPGTFSLAIKVEDINPAAKNSLLAIVMTTAAVALVFVNPVVGILSDTTRSRMGRRRPWMLGGLIAGLIGYTMIGVSSSFPVVLLGWLIGYLGLVTTGSMILTHMGDKLPESQRGKVAGINGAVGQVASIAGIVLAGALVSAPVLMFVAPAVIACVGSLIFMARMDDPSTVDEPRVKVSIKGVFAHMVFDPRQHRDFAWAWISKLLVFVALYMMSIYSVYFLGSRLGLDSAAVAALTATAGGASMMFAMLGAIGSGVISDKIGRRKPLVIASGVIMAVALLVIGLMTSNLMYIIGSVAFGFASGVFGAIDQALMLDVLPDRSAAGRWVAIMQLANEIPKAIAPAAAAGIVLLAGGGDNYQAVYFAAGAMALIGGLLVLPIRSVR